MNKQAANKNKSSSGFTLVEILVALTIIAIAMGALIKSTGSHTASASYLKQKTIAHYVAMNEIKKLHIQNEFPAIGTEKKSTDMAGQTWYWKREIEETGLQNPYTGKPAKIMRQVDITVYSDEDYEKSLTKLNGFIIKI